MSEDGLEEFLQLFLSVLSRGGHLVDHLFPGGLRSPRADFALAQKCPQVGHEILSLCRVVKAQHLQEAHRHEKIRKQESKCLVYTTCAFDCMHWQIYLPQMHVRLLNVVL